MSVLLVPAGNDGCRHYRMDVPATALRELGYDVQLSPQLMNFQTGETTLTPTQLCAYDSIVFQRPSTPSVLRLMAQLAGSGVGVGLGRPQLVVEMDDDLFSVPRGNPAYDYYARPTIRAAIADALRFADRLVVSTEPLAARLRPFTRPGAVITVAPNCLPTLPLAAPASAPVFDQLFFSGGDTHIDDLKLAAHAFGTYPTFYLGHDYSQALGVGQHVEAWTTRVEQHYVNLSNYGHGRVGLAPLVNTVFNRSKSDIRLLEYAAFGIDIVASNIGPYAHHDPILAYMPARWKARHLRSIVSDADARLERRRIAFDWAGTRTIDRHTAEYVEGWGLS